MSNSAINTQVAQQKIGNVQNQADSSAVYSAGAWSFKNASAVTSVTITDAGNVGIGTTNPVGKTYIAGPNTTNIGVAASNALNLAATGGALVGRRVNLGFAVVDSAVNNAASVAFEYTDQSNFGKGDLLFATRSVNTDTAPTERMRLGSEGNFRQTLTSPLTASVRPFLLKNTGFVGNGRNLLSLDSGNTDNSSSMISFEKNATTLWNIFNDSSANNGTDFVIWSASTGGVSLTSNTATSWSPRSSDERKKKNFETTQGLEEILQIEPVKYQFNSEDDSSPKRLGFKAQNLQPIIPEMVFPTGEKAEDGSDYLTITPDYLLPVLVKAIQELSAKVDAQAAEIAALKAS